MKECFIRCGGAAGAPSSSEDELALDLRGRGSNVQVDVRDISDQLVAHVPELLADVLDVATYVFCADQSVSRGGKKDSGTGKLWRRQFRIALPVRRPEVWSRPDVHDTLSQALSFVSEDAYTFEFSHLDAAPPLDQYLGLYPSGSARFPADEVALFSGGLDSLAGAADATLGQGKRVVLVSHRSAPKKASLPADLAKTLGQRAGGASVFHVPVWTRKESGLVKDYHQRTRSFLFASLAAVVARMLGQDEIRFYENGVTSLNLPLAAQTVGTRASRTTHPQVLNGYAELFSALFDQDFGVVNPFFYKTKGEVVGVLGELCPDLIGETVSCSRVVHQTKRQPHCGRCSQCVDRRFGVLAAGLGAHDPADRYELDLLLGERERGEARTMVECFYRRALDIQSMRDHDVLVRFPEIARVLHHLPGGASQVARDVLALQRRHAAEVTSVVNAGLGEHAPMFLNGDLEPHSLLRMALPGPYMRRVARGEAPPEADVRGARAGKRHRLQLVKEGVKLNGQLVIRARQRSLVAVVELLADNWWRQVRERRDAAEHLYVALGDMVGLLRGKMKTDDVFTIQRTIARADAAMREQHAELGLGVLADDELIEGNQEGGYRLNARRVEVLGE